jgi:hypothetical protein
VAGSPFAKLADLDRTEIVMLTLPQTQFWYHHILISRYYMHPVAPEQDQQGGLPLWR